MVSGTAAGCCVYDLPSDERRAIARNKETAIRQCVLMVVLMVLSKGRVGPGADGVSKAEHYTPTIPTRKSAAGQSNRRTAERPRAGRHTRKCNHPRATRTSSTRSATAVP
jgi:hypothetical protein